MSNLKDQLIRLGYKEPSLRKHLRPLIKVADWREDLASEKQIRYILSLLEDMSVDEWWEMKPAKEFHDRKPRKVPERPEDLEGLSKGVAGWMIGDLKKRGGGSSSSGGGSKKKKRKWPGPSKYKYADNWIKWLGKAWIKEFPSNSLMGCKVERDYVEGFGGRKQYTTDFPQIIGRSAESGAKFSVTFDTDNSKREKLSARFETPYIDDKATLEVTTDDKGLDKMFKWIVSRVRSLNNLYTRYLLENETIPKAFDSIAGIFSSVRVDRERLNLGEDFRKDIKLKRLQTHKKARFVGKDRDGFDVTCDVAMWGASRNDHTENVLSENYVPWYKYRLIIRSAISSEEIMAEPLRFRDHSRLTGEIKNSIEDAKERLLSFDKQVGDGYVVQVGKLGGYGKGPNHRSTYEAIGFMTPDGNVVWDMEYAAKYESRDEVPTNALSALRSQGYSLHIIPNDEAHEPGYEWKGATAGTSSYRDYPKSLKDEYLWEE